jgi:hypothetical protein
VVPPGNAQPADIEGALTDADQVAETVEDASQVADVDADAVQSVDNDVDVAKDPVSVEPVAVNDNIDNTVGTGAVVDSDDDDDDDDDDLEDIVDDG